MPWPPWGDRPQNKETGVVCTDEKTRIVVAAAPALQEWIIGVLGADGRFEVLFCTDNGLECLAAAERLRPELVVLGTELWQFTVIKTMRQLKKMHQAPKCLVLSQWVRYLPQQLALAGADGCLGIPCTRGAFLRQIGSVMGNYALTK